MRVEETSVCFATFQELLLATFGDVLGDLLEYFSTSYRELPYVRESL